MHTHYGLCRARGERERRLLYVMTTIHFLITSLSVILRMGDVPHKIRREYQKTRFIFNHFFFFENCAVFEIMWQIKVKPGRPQMTIWWARITYWISKATNTHTEYVIFTAFPLQQSLHGRASELRYMYTACLVWFSV
jgi:hypothetical protein